MTKRYWLPLTLLCLAGAPACTPPEETGGGEDGGSTPADAGSTPTDGGAGGTDAGSSAAECDTPQNAARRDQLLSTQPALAVRSKSILTTKATFASLAGDATKSCEVTLKFKDLNGNGTVEPYEDWRLTAQERAADLAGRMTAAQKAGLMAHATATDVPTGSNNAVSAGLRTAIETGGVRFATIAPNTTSVGNTSAAARANWANNVQAAAEATPLGVPVVLALEPVHSAAPGRFKARGFSQWPTELGLAASKDPAAAEKFGRLAAAEYRAVGVRLALSPSADLLTDPRWTHAASTFGEDGAQVGAMVAAYIKGFQGEQLSRTSVATVAKHFPGAGAAKGGADARLAKGKYLSFSGTNIDRHLAAFQKAVEAGVAGVMPGYAIPETGTWSGLNGQLSGEDIEQVGASFHKELLTDVLRGTSQFGGLVIAPAGVLEDAGVSPFGAPWGVEGLSRTQRAAKAIGAGVDQFTGLADASVVVAARDAGLVTDAQLDASARRALRLMFQLGLFEDPYVDAARAPSLVNVDAAYQGGLEAMARAMVLVHNADKPANWLDGNGDGTQTLDKGNAGNGTRKVLPAPPGEPYVAAGCRFFMAGNFDLDYVRSVSAGYGELTNDASTIANVAVDSPAERMAMSDYVFVRIDGPFTADPDSGAFASATPALEYVSNANAGELDDVTAAKEAIAAWNQGRSSSDPAYSRTQIVVGIDAGRLPVVSELLAAGVSGLYVEWGVSDKVFLDVAFGIVGGRGRLAAGVPASDAAAASQLPDAAGDGQHPTFVNGHGIPTTAF
jgi:beta-glucosidase